MLTFVTKDEFGNTTCLAVVSNKTPNALIKECFEEMQAEEVSPLEFAEWGIRNGCLRIIEDTKYEN